MVLSPLRPHILAPPQGLCHGQGPGAAWLCLWHCPCVPKDVFRGTTALLPRQPLAVVAQPQIPCRTRLWGQAGG